MSKFFWRNTAAAATLVFSTFASVQAAQFTTVDAKASRVEFSYHQMNVKMAGEFRELDATTFSFDSDKPADSRVAIKIPMSSIDAGYSEANAEVEKSEWLDTAAHPLAQFVSDSVEALGGNDYKVSGQLTIKGKTLPVSVPFTFAQQSGSGVFEGAFTFKRGDFGIGEGAWRDFGIVANNIEIKFHIVALP